MAYKNLILIDPIKTSVGAPVYTERNKPCAQDHVWQ